MRKILVLKENLPSREEHFSANSEYKLCMLKKEFRLSRVVATFYDIEIDKQTRGCADPAYLSCS